MSHEPHTTTTHRERHRDPDADRELLELALELLEKEETDAVVDDLAHAGLL